jgi:hypothetical protein
MPKLSVLFPFVCLLVFAGWVDHKYKKPEVQPNLREAGLPHKSERPTLQAAYREELARLPRPCSRKVGSRLDVAGCDLFGLRLYAPFNDVKARVEGSGFFTSREARNDNTELLAWADDFTLTMKFVQRDPSDKASGVLYYAEMYIHAGRKQGGRLEDDFEVQLVEKYGPPKSKFERRWGAENSDGPSIWYNHPSNLRLEDNKFYTERTTAIRQHKDRQNPIVKPPI